MKEGGHFYVLGGPEAEQGLAAAEFEALLGSPPEDARLPWCPAAADVGKAAYVSLCAEHIASAPDLGELCQRAANKGLCAEGFAIRESRIPRGLEVNLREAVIGVANCITGRPNLRNPSVEFIVVARPEEWHLGRIVSESDRSWARHARKLHGYSSSICSRMARCMVNIAGRAGQTLLDPCCGAGTILIEAASAGLEAVGCDINPLWARRASENARQLGLLVRTFAGDARQISGGFDAVVTNLPYGRNARQDTQEMQEILANLRGLAPTLVVVSAHPLVQALNDLGYSARLVAEVKKGNLVRRFHRCTVPRASHGEHADQP